MLLVQPEARAERVSGWEWHGGEMAPGEVFSSAGGWQPAAPGAHWHLHEGERGWLRDQVTIPASINGQPTAGRPIAIDISSGDGGAIYVDGKLQSRYDNDHPGAALLTERAVPGETHRLAVLVYGPVSGEKDESLDQADWELPDPHRIQDPLVFRMDAGADSGPLPRPLAGISQGGGMSDYRPETAAALAKLDPRWFRMDNVLTSVLQQKDGGRVYDWTDFDRRLDFITATGAEPILCLSYMPIPLDAIPDPDRHSAPRDYSVWEDLCFRAARRAIERGHRVRYWEVWNEANAGWLKPGPGDTPLEAYLKLYDASARGIRRADPRAWIGGPCNASGPWDHSAERGYAVNGHTFMAGLIDHCARSRVPLDFITWHEYFQPPSIYREEMQETRRLLDQRPAVRKGVKGFFLTEFNYAWWQDWPQDNEVGAAWAANNILRAAIPTGITGVCFFFAKDGDPRFRGSYGLLIGDNRPKPSYQVYRLFSWMGPRRVAIQGGDDDEISALASRDPHTGRLAILLVHFRDRYGLPRHVQLDLAHLPGRLRGGTLRQYLVDATHSNLFDDPHSSGAIDCVTTTPLPTADHCRLSLDLLPNSVTLLELSARKG